MRPPRDSASRLLRLLLLVELLRPSRCGPAHHKAVLCNTLKSAANQMDVIRRTAQRLQHHDDEAADDLLEARLQSLPVIATTAAHLRTWKANESLCGLYANALAFRAHADWLKAAAENVSLPSEAAGGAAIRLLRLADLVRTALIQMEAVVPSASPPPWLPTVSTAFEALRYSTEMSRRLKVFCNFSKRLVRHLRRAANCPTKRR
ncbi:uncharacterized protein LOC109515186 [Hippocampus comes]|uniref:uncharacterized protein LOC109515186 n=1 Tax=Hippocampus comes TaxID=109280 RepID=UPI00094F15E1|nr:PREDICTED: uncharacterized protein LOC109515186 [Hippocampus comes]